MAKRSGVDIKLNIDDSILAIEGASRRIVEAFARTTEAETKKNILRGSKTGQFYPVPKTSRIYQASAPGEAPASRTGALANSYNHQVISDSESIVFSDLKYSKIEFGWGDIAPRPHLRPAVAKVMKNKESIISKIVKQELS